MLVADREVDLIATHPVMGQLFSPADYYKEFTDLMEDDVIRELSRGGAKAETKRKRPSAALQLQRGG